MIIFVTGGSGFIGSNFIQYIIKSTKNKIINIDNLTYAANNEYLSKIKKNYKFYKSNIGNTKKINFLFKKFKPDAVINFAAETHVDNSIKKPNKFIKSNINDFYKLLICAKEYSDKIKNNKFKFIQISTDEVYGSLSKLDKPCKENTLFNPSSPYSSSKAAAELILNSFIKTFNFPGIITRCTNNYGKNQNKEKFIPKIISSCLQNKKIPIYGNGQQTRDWLFVEDHCRAIYTILQKGKIGLSYNISSGNEVTNISLVKFICQKLDKIYNNSKSNSFEKLIEFVNDRPAHDTRYSLDNSFIKKNLKWKARVSFENGINQTISWYLKNI